MRAMTGMPGCLSIRSEPKAFARLSLSALVSATSTARKLSASCSPLEAPQITLGAPG
jgi:hypothetical protein